MLKFQSHVAEGAADGSPLVVLLHGRGPDMGDLQALRGHLQEGTSLVTPQAPHPGAPWGYGSGWAWYRYLREDRPESTSLDEGLEELETFLNALADHVGFEPGSVVLGGFSQGGTVSLAYALRRPGAVTAVLVFSGFLAAEDVLRPAPGGFEATPIFWGHGMSDGNIPLAMAEAGRRRLLAEGADLIAHDYPIGHWIAPEELLDANEFLMSHLESR